VLHSEERCVPFGWGGCLEERCVSFG